MKKNLKELVSKMVKTHLVMKDRQLAQYVPLTRSFTRNRLRIMLKRYRMVYVKPDKGSKGIGVMRVENKGNKYQYRSGIRTYTFPRFRSVYHSMKKRIGKRRYLVQKGIDLLRLRGRPFDFRIMVQKNPAGRWVRTGIVGRVAHPLKAVTNGSQGGTIYPASVIIQSVTGSKKTTALVLREMHRIAQLTATQFTRKHPHVKELGLDIAVDRKLHPWILEVNIQPDPCPFTKLANKTMIKKIVRYARAYGQEYRLDCNKAKSAPISSR